MVTLSFSGYNKLTILIILQAMFAMVIWIFAPLRLRYRHLLSPWFFTMVANRLSTLYLLLYALENLQFPLLPYPVIWHHVVNRCQAFCLYFAICHFLEYRYTPQSLGSNLNLFISLLFFLSWLLLYDSVLLPFGQVTLIKSVILK